MQRTRIWVTAGLVVATAAVIAACSPSSARSSNSAASLGGGGQVDSAAAEPGAAAGATAGGATSAGSGGKAVDTAVTLTSPALILTGDLEVRVGKAADVAVAASRAEGIAAGAPTPTSRPPELPPPPR
jgi:hypothetical protein